MRLEQAPCLDVGSLKIEPSCVVPAKVVVQNVFTSLFNSHLFDFHEGWMYVLSVGVAGGMTLGATPHRFSRTVSVAGAMQVFAKVLLAFAIVVFLFGAWFFSNYFRTLPPDSPLDRETRSIVAALREYRIARMIIPLVHVSSKLA